MTDDAARSGVPPADTDPDGIDAAVAAELPAVVGAPVVGVTTERLSSGLSRAGVFRVRYQVTSGPAGSVVVKIPDLSERSGVENSDAGTLDRELLLLRAGFAAEANATGAVRLPPVLALRATAGRTWIWLADLGESFGLKWTPPRAVAVGELAARVHDLADLPSVTATAGALTSREYAAYAHHVPLCRRNLDRVERAPDPPLDAAEIATARQLLDRTPWALSELDRRPVRFCHGDLNPRNIGAAEAGWVVTDWASAGWAPAGSDLAVFLSTYDVFGGDRGDRTRGALAEDLVQAYVAALGDATAVSARDVRDVLVLWWLTWGLHLRLGPGLRALLDAGVGPGEAAAITADVRAGLADCAAGLARLGGEAWS